MSRVYEFVFLVMFCDVMALVLAGGGQRKCPALFSCGHLGSITFPFTKSERKDCGFFPVSNCDHPNYFESKEIQLQKKGKWVQFRILTYHHYSPTVTTLVARDNNFYKLLHSNTCEAFRNNYTISNDYHSAYVHIQSNETLFKCNSSLHVRPPPNMYYNYKCSDYNYYWRIPRDGNTSLSSANVSWSSACTVVQLPIKDVSDGDNPLTFITADIFIEVKLTDECADCHYHHLDQTQLDSRDRFCCVNVTKTGLSFRVKLGLGLGIGTPFLMIIGLLFIFLLYKQKHATSGGQLESRDSYSDSSSNHHLASRSKYFGVPLFSYEQLKQATNDFDHNKELGDGGFGTVYYGKLPDEREVAVKRLYEHNWKRVEQFMNEVRILTRLHHKHLVSLYGCTSRHSRELLLVYEYISNGTVACHLHGELAKPGSPPLSTRMKIAIETASALAYLHASDIIHRDVKTNNILLDNNFCVKVADFGLSRDFPNDVTHVSTAPQGSPGYLDPEYYNCYQLTSKSDVYSFGVVLIELISSKPAVDMNRSRDEINLSNLAVRKIQESAIGELVDPSLGFESNDKVKGMIVAVAGLAFQCLQREKDLRPSMDEVLHQLRRIESWKDEGDDVNGVVVSHICAHSAPPPASPEWEHVGLLKNIKPTSPDTVTDKWESKCTTPNVSG